MAAQRLTILSKVILCFLLVLGSTLALAQGGAITGQVVTTTGYPAAGALVRVCPYTSSGNPCSPLANIYSDPGLTSQIGNPWAADQYGNYSIFVAAGYYIVQITPTAGTTYSYLVSSAGQASVYLGCVSPIGGGIACQTTGVPRPVYDVTQFGAAGTGAPTTGTINVSSNPNQMTVASNSGFTVGQIYNVPAGIAGASLTITVTSVNGNLIGFTPAASTSINSATVDDSAGIQAAFNACYNNGATPHGGVILFPGNHTYVVSSTINVYDSCQIQGVTSGIGPHNFPLDPVGILWNGPSINNTISFTSFTIAANSSSLTSPATPNNAYPILVTVNATNTYAVNEWVHIDNCSSFPGGWGIDRLLGQVVQASGSSFSIGVPASTVPANGSYTDTTCTAQQTTVEIAHDAINGTQWLLKGVQLADFAGAGSPIGVSIFAGTRLDSGSGLDNVWVDGSNALYGVYFPSGGLDVNFAGGWRFDDSASIANVYTRSSLQLNIGGTGSMTSNVQFSPNNIIGGGANFFFDDWNCAGAGNGLQSYLTSTGKRLEQDGNYLPGFGSVMVGHCPSDASAPELYLTDLGEGLFPATTNSNGANQPYLVVSPESDVAVQWVSENGLPTQGIGTNITPRVVGVPSLTRSFLAPSQGGPLSVHYSAPQLSLNPGNRNGSVDNILSDLNFNNFTQYGIAASNFLFSDAAFAALPAGTTLTTGQTIAPGWNTTSTIQRFPLDVVKTPGTTGIPNLGLTYCTTGSSSYTCSSATATILTTSCPASSTTLTVTTTAFTLPTGATTNYTTGTKISLAGTGETVLHGLSGLGTNPMPIVTGTGDTQFTVDFPCNGGWSNSSDTGTAFLPASAGLSLWQYVFISGAGATRQILSVQNSNLTSVVVNLNGSVTTVASPTQLTFTAPVLNNEIQLPTKSAAAPSSGTWSQGDMEQNSGASVYGIAAWVNVAAGTPGTWGTIPAGDANGNITGSQVVAGSGSILPVCFNGTNNSLTTSGCNLGIASQTPNWLQYLGTGVDGAYSLTTGSSGTGGVGDFYYTSFNVSSGATLEVTNAGGLVIHSTGACTVNGNITTEASGNNSAAVGGGTGGGGGGGTAAGTAGTNVGLGYSNQTALSGGTAGAGSGGNGGNGSNQTNSTSRAVLGAGPNDGQSLSGAPGGAGGNNSGSGGNPGYAITLICASITGTGTITANGYAGGNSTGNNVGPGGGGGGGLIMLSSQAAETFGITVNVAGGAGGSCLSFTGCGTAGTGGNGFTAEFSGW